MSDKDWSHNLTDILHSIERIEKAVSGISYAHFQEDEDIQDIVMRRFQIIGEAARKIPDHVKDAHPAVPWRQMIGLRNMVVHEYSYVDLKIVWDTIATALPDLKLKISKIS